MIRRLMAAPLALAVVLAPVAFGASSCACGTGTAAAASDSSGGCSDSGSIQSCSPYAEDANQFGKIGVQQKGPQQKVFWGVYPTDPAGIFTLTVTVNGSVMDKKPPQPYPPHGTVPYDPNNKRLLPSGGLFEINGTVTRANGEKEGFYFRCTLA